MLVLHRTYPKDKPLLVEETKAMLRRYLAAYVAPTE
jgi:hypothetical protein